MHVFRACLHKAIERFHAVTRRVSVTKSIKPLGARAQADIVNASRLVRAQGSSLLEARQSLYSTVRVEACHNDMSTHTSPNAN
jgi:hypothetical protein